MSGEPSDPPRAAATRLGRTRPLAVYSQWIGEMPITAEEIHKVLASVGADLVRLIEDKED